MKKIFLWWVLFGSIFVLWWCSLKNTKTPLWNVWTPSWKKQETAKIQKNNERSDDVGEKQWWNTSEDDAIQGGQDNVLQSIQQRFQLWNNPETPYTLKKLDLTWSTEWGVATYYYDGDDLKKIIARYYGETGKELYELYYDEGNNLFFVFHVSTTYTRPLFVDDAEAWEEEKIPDHIVEQRYYFDKGTMILRKGEDNQKMPSNTDSFQRKEKNLLRFSQILLDKATRDVNGEEE